MEQQYRVVVNGEGQYSIWPADRAGVPGWQGEGFVGSKAECLARIGEVWQDIRPASLRA
ncbi:MbtH family protein (plasmid) [Streptomyces sp. NBC_01136]|uniref:MbtH family protein n=1 Tax=unclassified Streptomyces TaxID=2593676 RepID=UPI002F91508C|nr:MbtH family protein [Streptomyces sp. NBC_01136]